MNRIALSALRGRQLFAFKLALSNLVPNVAGGRFVRIEIVSEDSLWSAFAWKPTGWLEKERS